MNKKIFLLFLIGLLCLTLFSCRPSETELSATRTALIENSNAIKTAQQQAKDGAPASGSTQYQYRVTKSTYLYDSASIDAGHIAEFSVGTILVKADENLNCVTLEESGTTYHLCRMKNVVTGSTGWVLFKWLQAIP